MKIKMSSKNILSVMVIVLEVNISLQQQHCLPSVSSQTGFALVGKEYTSFTTKDYPTCVRECQRDERCMSVNYHLITKTCDLNTQTKESQPTRYQERPNSIYTTNMAFRTPRPPKGAKEHPGRSCLDILVSGDSLGTGVYWIDPDNTGRPIQAYCDMRTDEGGWTTVKKTLLTTSNEPPPKEFIDTYQVIASYDRKDKWIIPKTDAMMDIKNKMGFHQIHFYCYKKSVDRVVSIMTKNNTAGQQVVTFFSTPGTATVFPTACGSFDRLPEDTSFLSQNCTKWGTSGPTGGGYPLLSNKWEYYTFHGAGRLGTIPFQMNLPPKYFYGYTGNSARTDGFCDDNYDAPSPYSANDTWIISVR